MTRKLTETLLLSLFLFAFLAGSVFGLTNDKKLSQKLANLKYTMLKNKIMGDDEYSMKVLGEEGNVDDFEGLRVDHVHRIADGARHIDPFRIVPERARRCRALGSRKHDKRHHQNRSLPTFHR